jgi:hypothetical protein
MMRPPFPLPVIQSLGPSEHTLLTLLCEQLSDEALMLIARADYGYAAEANFTDLKQLVGERIFPAQMTFQLHEVLQLTRWHTPETREELLARSYSCVLLLHLHPETQYDETAASSSLIALVDSAIRLPEFRRPILQFVAWKVLHLYERELAYCREDGEDESEAYAESYSLFALLLLMILNDSHKEDVRAVYDELTDHKNTDAERAGAVHDLVQESGVMQTMWKDIVSRYLIV